MRNLFVFIAAFAAMVIVQSCSCGGNVPQCASNSDCGAGQTCLAIRACAPTCSADSECTGGGLCSSSGGCVPASGCGSNADCKDAKVCSASMTCIAGTSCTSDSDCGALDRCANSACEPIAGCRQDSECGTGKVCDSVKGCTDRCTTTSCTGGTSCAPTGHCADVLADGGFAGCGGFLFESTHVQANMFIVLDRSGSMEEEVGGASKWSSAAAAVRAVTTKHEASVRFGLEMFPTAQTQCATGSVVVPLGDTKAGAIDTALPATAEGQGTPIGASLGVAAGLKELEDTARANYVLLVTDGKENCKGDPVDQVKKMFAKNIKTYVVGFGGEVNQQMLSSMATEGGTARATGSKYYQANDAASLNAALDSIASGAISCDFQLGKAPPDVSKIYVYVNGQQIPHDPTKKTGWEFSASNNHLTFYGPTCDSISKNPNARVSIVYGCPDNSLIETGSGSDGGTDTSDGGGVIIN